MSRGASKGAARRLAMSFVVLLLFLVAGEAVARRLPTSSIETRDAVVQELTPSHELVASTDVPGWDLDPEGGYKWNTSYHTNQWHMRGPDYPPEKGSKDRRVIFIGDSCTFGFGLDWEDTFSARFAELREKDRPGWHYQVSNCACPGHTTYQSTFKLQRHCLAFQPDIVVIANMFNDATMTKLPDAVRFEDAGPVGRALEKSALYRALRNAWLRNKANAVATPEEVPQWWNDSGKGTVSRVPPEDYEANLRRMIAISREAGATPVLLLLPVRGDVYEEPMTNETVVYRALMRKVAEEEGVLLVDGVARFDNMAPYDGLFTDQVHPGELGARILGSVLNEQLPE